MNTVNAREKASDNRLEPTVHYVYILRLKDDSVYVGQTNDLASRVVEHAIDAGAEATNGQTPQLVWFSHTHDRDGAHQMEQRLQSALKRSPLVVEALIERFSDLLDIVRPQKTLPEQRREEQEHEAEMLHVVHHVPHQERVGPVSRLRAACGWDAQYCSSEGMSEYARGQLSRTGLGSHEELAQLDREHKAMEAVGSTLHKRKPCQKCLVAPTPGYDQGDNLK